MTKNTPKKSPTSTVREALAGQGYALHLSTEREGDTLIAKLELLNLKEDRSLLKVVGSGRLVDIDLTLGLRASEEGLWDLVLRLLDFLSMSKE